MYSAQIRSSRTFIQKQIPSNYGLRASNIRDCMWGTLRLLLLFEKSTFRRFPWFR